MSHRRCRVRITFPHIIGRKAVEVNSELRLFARKPTLGQPEPIRAPASHPSERDSQGCDEDPSDRSAVFRSGAP